MLYRHAPAGLATTVGVALLLGAAVYGRVPTATVLAWLSILLLIIAGRYGLLRRYRSAPDAESNSVSWSRRYVHTAAITGLAWGVGGSVFASLSSGEHRTLVLLIVAAMSACAIAYLASVLRAYVGYVLGVALPLLGWFVFESEMPVFVLALLTCAFVAAMCLAARRLNGLLTCALELQFDNSALASQLESSNRRLRQDIAQRERAEATLAWERTVLGMVAAEAELEPTLDALVQGVERLYPDVVSFIRFVDADGRERCVGSAPSSPLFGGSVGHRLPDEVVAGPRADVDRPAKVIAVAHIEEEGAGTPYREAARELGITTCWSLPITSPRGEDLGRLALYVREQRSPRPAESQFIQRTTYLAAIAIERARARRILRESEERFRHFAQTAADWFWETDADLRYSYVSERYESVTGIAGEAVIGRMPVECLPALGVDAGRCALHQQTMESRRGFDDLRLERVAADGTVKTDSISGIPVFDERGVFRGYRGSGRDITRAQSTARTLAFHASHDALTGVVNRTVLEQRLRRAVESARRHGREHVLCYLDLDRLKQVNDCHGHDAGDRLLRELAGWLRGKIRARDTLARLGGDEFALLLENCAEEQGVAIARRLVAAWCARPFVWRQRRLDVGLSAGLVSLGPDCVAADRLLACADAACYRAKHEGGARVHVHRWPQNPAAVLHDERVLSMDFSRLVKQARLRLFAQPIHSLRNREEGRRWYELLLKVVDDDGQVGSAHGLIRQEEERGQITAVDKWVIDAALRLHAQHCGGSPDVRFSINISGTSLGDGRLLDHIRDRLGHWAVSPAAVCFEITETAAIRNLTDAARGIAALRRAGCRFALDDFGTGVSSFAYLKHLPVDYLKIDGSFVRGMSDESLQRSMTAVINQVGHTLGLKTIAEWADSDRVLRDLRRVGVDYAQGVAVSPTVSLETISRPSPVKGPVAVPV